MTTDRNKPPERKDRFQARAPGGNGRSRRAGEPAEKRAATSGRITAAGHDKEIRDLVDAVLALPDVRWEKVAAIRTAIESGTYVVDPAKIAQKMIDEIG